MKTSGKFKKKNKSLIVTVASLVVLGFLVIIIGGVVIFNKSQKQMTQLSSENTALGGALAERDSMVNELINAFDSIEQNLSFINKRRSQLVIENRETTNPSKKESIIKDIKLMNTMLEESSAEIEELEKKLKKSGIQLRSFKNKIASLNKSIKKQNNQIVDLKLQFEEQNLRLDIANYQMDSLQNELFSFRDSLVKKEDVLVHKEEVILQQETEINKGFFVYGTFKELVDNGVVAKEGGFLGIGKNKILKQDFNKNYFTKIDIIEDRSFPLNVKKVKLISKHPVDSYKLIEEDGLITKLEIEIPEDFWKLSTYAVIEVKL